MSNTVIDLSKISTDSIMSDIEQLVDISEQIKALEAKKKEITEKFKKFHTEDNISKFISPEGHKVTVAESHRDTLNKKAVVAELGEEWVKENTKTTNFLAVRVTRAK